MDDYDDLYDIKCADCERWIDPHWDTVFVWKDSDGYEMVCTPCNYTRVKRKGLTNCSLCGIIE